jgi:hypothetical protein
LTLSLEFSKIFDFNEIDNIKNKIVSYDLAKFDSIFVGFYEEERHFKERIIGCESIDRILIKRVIDELCKYDLALYSFFPFFNEV